MTEENRARSDVGLPVLDAGIFGGPVAQEKVADGHFDFVEPHHAEFPPIIIVAVTNVCDMACIHCAHPVIKKDPGYKGAFMDPAIHTKIVEETKQFKDKLWVFRYAADGESMLHPHFLDFVEETKAAGIGPVDLTTNAMSLDEEKMWRLLLAPIDLIDVSTDAYTKETYERIRVKGKFDVVTANTKRLIEMRNELKSPTKILVSIIDQKEAKGEVEAFKAYWGQFVDEVLVRGLNNDLGLVNAAELYFDDNLTRWPCPQFWKRVTINHHGEVRFCVEDWRNHGVVANLREQTIQEIWKSDLYQRFRDLHASGNWGEMKMCEHCQDWQHMEWDYGFEKAVQKVMNS
jgi:radical SAM protein with 4Fe4S-binding SPASM domain